MGGYDAVIWFIIIGALLYFMMKGGGCCGGGGSKKGKASDSEKAPKGEEGRDSDKKKGCH